MWRTSASQRACLLRRSLSPCPNPLTLYAIPSLAHVASMIHELPNLRVTVDRVVFAPHLDAPPERPYPFVYFITIHNESDKTVTLKGRKWVVTDSLNQSVVVEGEGVVGKFPTLSPGESFSYNSYHVTASDSVAQGAFLALTEENVAVFARIPPFALVTPKGGA